MKLLIALMLLSLTACAKPDCEAVKEVHFLMQRHFQVDKHKACEPVSYADELLRGETITGVCTHYALTASDLLERRGVEHQVWKVRTRLGVPHMVVVTDGWVLDLRERAVWPVEQFDYEWVKIN